MTTSISDLGSDLALSIVANEGPDPSAITISDAQFLFHADFKRAGSDLVLTGDDGHRVVVPGYFSHERLPALLSPQGAMITGDTVEALAGSVAPGQYAQATPAAAGPPPIGKVATAQGSVTALRNGVSVTLNAGNPVLKGDVIQTGAGSEVGIIFLDGSTFSLSSSARMVLNEFIYDANGSSNSASINLVQGTFSFLAGAVAKTGDMKVGTPVATMGIRGTAVNVTISADNGAANISVMAEPDNLTHTVQVFSLPTPADLAAGRTVGALLGTVTNNSGVFSFTPTPTGVLVQETGKSPAVIQAELAIVGQVFSTQAIGQQFLGVTPQNPKTTVTYIDPGANSKNGAAPTDFKVTIGGTGDSSVTKVVAAVPHDPPAKPPAPPPIVLVHHNPVLVANADSVVEDGKLIATGNVLTTAINLDAAIGDTLSINELHRVTAHGFGVFALQSDGSYSFALNNQDPLVQALAVGETATEVFSYTVASSAGLTAQTTITFTITGTNDAPVIDAHNGGNNVLLNGSFESGLSGWTTHDLSLPLFALQTVGAGVSSGFGFFSTNPTDGNTVFVTGFDGGGPGVITLSQSVVLVAGSALDFDYRAAWDMLDFGGSTAARLFTVTVTDNETHVELLQDIILTADPNTLNLDTGNLAWHLDLGAFAGHNVELSFNWSIPENFTGPAFFQLDNVRLLDGSVSYAAHQAATAIDTALTISDVDNASLVGATVSIENFQIGEDVLGFAAQNGITGSYVAGTGVLTLSGTATVAQYQAALRSVTYFNSSDTPSIGTRIIDFQVDDGSHVNNLSNAATVSVSVTLVSNIAPTITGDLSFTVDQGASQTLTTVDFRAIDADSTDGQLTFTVANPSHGHVTVNGSTSAAFTQQQLVDGAVAFVHDGSNSGLASFQVTVTDGIANSVTQTVLAFAPVVTAQVLTAGGINLSDDVEYNNFGGGVLQSGWTSTTFTVVNLAANRFYVYEGAGFQLDNADNPTDVLAGTISAIHAFTFDETHVPLFDFTGLIDAAAWYHAVVASNAGDQNAGDALSSGLTFSFTGGAGSDSLSSGDLNDAFSSSGGNDLLDGQGGFDRASYQALLGPIDVALADGTVTKYTDDTRANIGGSDTLNSIEFVTGTTFNDTYDATGFNFSSANSGSIVTSNVSGAFNEFEGLAGNDVITGNGSTRISYLHATSGVVVGLAAGTADGDATVGHDTFSALPANGPFTSGINSVRGSYFSDTLSGSNSTGTENFEGRGGNDFIDGRGGFDRAAYSFEDAGITVNLGAGSVVGGVTTGTDTLRSIEAISGTEFDDSYDASTFTAANAATPSVNSGNGGSNGSDSPLNEFEGRGGDDTVSGNGTTRVVYASATAGVSVSLSASGAGTSVGTAHKNLLSYDNIDPAGVGSDTFTGGVTQINGSEFNDRINGNIENNALDGRGADDVIDGRGGDDQLIGGTGSDRFVYSTNQGSSNGGSGGADVVIDFSRSDFDRLDIRGTGLNNFNAVSSLISQSGGDTVITFASTAQAQGTNTLTLNGFTGSLNRSDFIFAGQVAVTVHTSDGYNFGTLYDDIAGVNLALTTHDASNFILVAPTAGPHGSGLIFDLNSNNAGFTYDQNGNYVSGAVNNIIIYDTSYNELATLVGWSNIASVTSLLTARADYVADPANTSGLDTIFRGASYSAVGNFSSFFANHSVNGGGDTFISGAGNDVFNGLTNTNGGDFNFGDTVDYSHVASAVTINLGAAAESQTSGGGGNDILINIENLRGSAFNDTLTGNGSSNTLEGGDGNDVLDGVAGGFDTASYEHTASSVTVSLATTAQQDTGGAGLDTLTNFQALRGSAFDDILTGNGASTLEGGAGDDQLIGQSGGFDTASYQHATAGVNVSLVLAGSPQNTGGAGSDTLTDIKNLTGSTFSDHLTGDGNDNILNGGFGGKDALTGGTGADIFQFGAGNVTITDFNVSAGDKIELFRPLTSAQVDALIAATTGDTLNFGTNGSLTLTGVDVAQALDHNAFILHA